MKTIIATATLLGVESDVSFEPVPAFVRTTNPDGSKIRYLEVPFEIMLVQSEVELLKELVIVAKGAWRVLEEKVADRMQHDIDTCDWDGRYHYGPETGVCTCRCHKSRY